MIYLYDIVEKKLLYWFGVMSFGIKNDYLILIDFIWVFVYRC